MFSKTTRKQKVGSVTQESLVLFFGLNLPISFDQNKSQTRPFPASAKGGGNPKQDFGICGMM